MDRTTKIIHSELCKAINDGDTRTVQCLLIQGAQADAVGGEGVAAIHLAVGKENEKNQRCLKLMLQHGVNPNIKTSDGLTPLHIAAVWGCFQNVKLLLTNGGDPNLTDNDGNTPLQLAKEQGNRKCAQILQGFQTNSAETEEEDVPRFHYSVYSDLTDISSFLDSESSFSSSSSRISDFGEAPLSSTRRSSFFTTNNKPNGLSHMHNPKRFSQEWNSWTFEGPSLLSSTRVSSAGRLSSLPVLKEHDLWTNVDRKTEPLPVLPVQQNGRKSVTFRDVDEFFPVFSPDSNRHSPRTEGTSHSLTFDPTEYSDFLDTERMATVCHTQGIDVTSPDHVYVFQRESSDSTEEILEKTVNAHFALVESDEDEDEEEQLLGNVEGFQTEKTGSGSSGTTSSRYSSCDSDHYTSALENTENLRVPFSAGECKVEENNKECIETKEIQEYPIASSQPSLNRNNVQYLSDSLNNLALSEANHQNKDADSDGVKPYTKNPDLWDPDLSFMSSPFVTDRTRARLSRCSMRTSRASGSLLATSTLFEDTLPTPVRSHRPTPQSRNSERNYNNRNTASPTSNDPNNDEVVATLFSESQGETVSLSQTNNDTYPFVETQGESFFLDKDAKILDDYERNFAEIVKAIQNEATDNFLTDDLTSADDGKRDVGEASEPSADEAWVTEDCQPDSASSSSSSSYFSPRRSREDCDLPCTPGTGCTPRYSMSRLSGCSRPRSYASVSYTPGGRPQMDDVDEPVEYLYTDTEQGHTFIETHIPPTANTSMSSSSSSDETILYDWRSMHRDLIQTEKENQKPKPGPQRSSSDSDVEILPETRGLTDRELRMRLLDLGESPGPICSRTRPTYMRKLCRLLDQSKKRPQNLQEPSDQTLSGYSPELCRALRTFELPQCQEEEQALCRQFEQADHNRKWREGVIKSSFNYLLLDPRVTNNLPFRSHTLSPHECFKTFVNAIFYVGKGKRSRPYSHLYEALDYFKGEKTSKKLCRKVDHILHVWNAGQGVISLHCFQNVIPVEAYTREACMVEAIGLKMLTNQKRGDYYGVVSHWQQRKKKELGVHLLYRAMQIFLAEGERQLRPADIRQ
ncbi:unnamed protein product [Knipowitschia caucasica]|uniref:LEM domain-containing protein n=1 Tax=Knipowitschia caucasica TaxID=637954 RepID=A0AAV2KU53_KNICA